MSTTIVPEDVALPDVASPVASTMVSEICAPMLLLGVQLRSAQDVGDPSLLRRRTRELSERIESQLVDARLPDTEVRNISFALVAFIDEAISQSNWVGKAEWIATPMHFELFHHYNAGEEFFTRLTELQRDREIRSEGLRVYHLCMTLGFKGRYLVQGDDQFARLVRDVAEQLQRIDGRAQVPLAPHARQTEVLAQAARQIPVWIVAVIAIGLAFLVYVILTVAISWRAAAIEELLR
ncbi:MAG: DotU family type IV/VI secretion system protein [Gemmatimonadaceae bacterium]